MQYILVAVVVAGFCFIYGRIWLRRRRETPLRREIRARDITFRTPLNRVSVKEPGWLQPDSDFEVPVSSPVELIVRGDAFEICSARSLGRVVMGLEYLFRASETSVELNRQFPGSTGGTHRPGSSYGWRAGSKVRPTIRQDNDPLEIWNALTGAGAVPGSAWVTPGEQA